MLERGEADIIYLVQGELIDRIKNNPKLMLEPVVSGSWWLEFPGFQDPKNPFHVKRVREAVSLTIDRKAINDAESGGMGRISGNWINDDVEYALDWPQLPEPLILGWFYRGEKFGLDLREYLQGPTLRVSVLVCSDFSVGGEPTRGDIERLVVSRGTAGPMVRIRFPPAMSHVRT